MLEVFNVKDLDSKKLNIVKKKTVKKQILLYDTNRRADDFINQLKFRRNGNYDNIPHYLITKQGLIYNFFDTKYSSNTFGEPKIDKRFIKIAIENLGWLSKNTITGFLHNWIGDTYRLEPFIGEWRGYFYWDRYTDQQFELLAKLLPYLCDKHNIRKEIVKSSAYTENILKFDGVICKSNFSNIYLDINPSFNFNLIFNYEEKKQL